MGARRDYTREGEGDWATPKENPEIIGCPGAWYRTDFLDSLLKRYYRQPDESRNRVSNPAFDKSDDMQVHEAITLLEGFEDAAHADYLNRLHEMRTKK